MKNKEHEVDELWSFKRGNWVWFCALNAFFRKFRDGPTQPLCQGVSVNTCVRFLRALRVFVVKLEINVCPFLACKLFLLNLLHTRRKIFLLRKQDNGG
jgi:hypothetical protein